MTKNAKKPVKNGKKPRKKNQKCAKTGWEISRSFKACAFFYSLHDRKMFVLGLCSILGINGELRPKGLHDCASKIIPSLLLIFSGLQRSYESKFKSKILCFSMKHAPILIY